MSNAAFARSGIRTLYVPSCNGVSISNMDSDEDFDYSELLNDVLKDDTERINNIYKNKSFKRQSKIVEEERNFLETASMEDKKKKLDNMWSAWKPRDESLEANDNIKNKIKIPVIVPITECGSEVPGGKSPVNINNYDPIVKIKCDISELLNHFGKLFKLCTVDQKLILKQRKIPFKIIRICELYLIREFNKLILDGIYDKKGVPLDVLHFLHPDSVADPIPSHFLNRFDFKFDKLLVKDKYGPFTKRINTVSNIVSNTTIFEDGQKVFNINDAHNCLNDYLNCNIDINESYYSKDDFYEVINEIKIKFNDNKELWDQPHIFDVENDICLYDGTNLETTFNSIPDSLQNYCSSDEEFSEAESGYESESVLPINPVQFAPSKPIFDVLKISDKSTNIINKINRISGTIDEKYCNHEIVCGDYGSIDVKIDDFDNTATIFAINHNETKQKGREFYKNILGINVNISGSIISAELDSGSAYCILGLKTISRLDKDWETKYKKLEFKTPLKGVTGKSLDIIGAYQVPVKFPIIGVKNLNIKVIANQDLFLIGRDFLTANNVTISFHPTKYTITFGRSLTNITLNKSCVLDFVDGITNMNLNLNNEHILPGTYVVSMVDDVLENSIGIQLPEQLVSLNDSKSCVVKLIAPNFVNNSVYAEVTLNLVRVNKEEEYISTGLDWEIDQLSNGFIRLPSSYQSIHDIPSQFRYLFDQNNEEFCPSDVRRILSGISKTDKGINQNVCIECVTNKNFSTLSIPKIVELHKDHKNIIFGSEECEEFVSKIIKQENLAKKHRQEIISKVNISKESENIDFEFDDNDKNFSHLSEPDGMDLIPGEIGVPQYKTKSMIDATVKEKLKDLPSEVQKILYGPLFRNEAMSVCPWDIPPVKGEALHYEVKDIPKTTKIYPVKKEDLRCLYSTLQFLLFYRIIDRAPVDSNFGSPTFLISRKRTATESSRSPRLLVDARLINQSLKCVKSASMTSCYDQLRQMCSGTKYLSSIDLSNMFFSLPNSKELIESGAVNFTTVYGCFRLLRSLQGGALSPAFANNVIMKRLNLDSQGIPSYISDIFHFYDDINLTSKDHYTIVDHANDLADLLNRVHAIGFMINLKKSKFCVDLVHDNIEILGLNINRNSISATEKRKKDIINQLITPKSKVALQRVIGLCNYLRNLMQADDLRSLNILSTKLKFAKLNWDQEGEAALKQLKTSLETRDFILNIPDSEFIPVLFSDASASSCAGILYYLKIESIENDERQYPNITQSKSLESHNNRFNIATTALTQKYDNLLNFLCEVFYHYNPSDNRKNDHVLSLVIKSLIILMPQLLHKITYQNVGENEANYRSILRQIDEGDPNLTSQVSAQEIILNGLAHTMRRQIILISLTPGYQNKTAFVRLTGEFTLSPILIYHEKNEFQLLALMKNDIGFQNYSTKTVEDLSSTEVLKLFKANMKQEKLIFGGVYSFSLPDSYKNVSIYIKELLALSSSLSYWSSYLKMGKSFLFIDSSTVLYGLKNVKSKGLGKLHRIGISMAHGFPKVQVFLVPTKINPADHYSRIHEEENSILNCPNMEMSEFTNSFVNSSAKASEKFKELGIKIDESEEIVALIGEEDIRQYLDPAPTYASIQNIIQLYYKDQVNMNRKYKYTNGYYLNSQGKIYLPKELYLSFILLTHASYHHPGVEKTLQILKNEFCFENQKIIQTMISSLIKSCIACSESKSSYFKSFNYQSNYGAEIMNSLSIDIIESTKFFAPQANLPIHSVLGIICNVSKYATIYYLSSGSSNEIVMSLLSFFSKHRIPKFIYADNGSNLRNKKVYSLLNSLKVIMPRSSPFASKARGKVENFFKQLRSASRVFGSYYKGVNELLSFIYFIKVYNNIPLPIKNISVTPAFLALFPHSHALKQIDYTSQLNNNFSKLLRVVNSDTMIQEELDMQKVYDKAVEAIKLNVSNHNLKINKNRFDHKFIIGDIVIGRNFARTRKNQPLFNRDLLRIIEINGSLFILQSIVTSLVIQRHILHIKGVRIAPDKDINEIVQEKFGIFTEKYVKNLIQQYEKDSQKRVNKERDQILTRSKAKAEEKKIAEQVELYDDDDEEYEVTFQDN